MRISAFKLVLFLLVLGSCEHTETLPTPAMPSPIGPGLSDAAGVAGASGQDIDQSASKISDSANSVGSNAVSVGTKIDPTSRGRVIPHLDIIKVEVGNILSETAKVRGVGVDISKLAVSLQGLALNVQTLTQRAVALEDQLVAEQENNESLNAELGAALDEKNAALRRGLMYMVFAGTVIIAICVTLFFTGNPKAIGGSIAGIVLISVAMAIMAITKYMWLFGIIGGLGALVVLFAMIYHIVDYLNHKKGLHEVIATGELAKKALSDTARESIFGPIGESGRAGQIQSKKTESLVKLAKSRLEVK